MKFIITSNEINEAVKKMGKILRAKASLPILGGVLVEAREDCILFTASDGDESIIHRVLTNENIVVTEKGKSVFPKEVFDIAKKLKDIITFDINDTHVTISKDKTQLDFPTMDPNEYPVIKVESSSSPLVLSGGEFSYLVEKTSFSASKSDVRPILQAINLQYQKGSIIGTSTDSHRLSKVEFKVEQNVEPFSLPISANILEHATKSFDLSKDVMISTGENTIALINGSTILISTLLSGNYPETSRLIPLDFESNIVLNRRELIDGLELLQSISTNSVVNLTVDNLFVALEANGTGTKGIKEIAFEFYEGEEALSVSFSAQYALDALKSIDSPSVKLCFNGSAKPFIIVSNDVNHDAIQLILPVRQM